MRQIEKLLYFILSNKRHLGYIKRNKARVENSVTLESEERNEQR
jgi:hypothetical protein